MIHFGLQIFFAYLISKILLQFAQMFFITDIISRSGSGTFLPVIFSRYFLTFETIFHFQSFPSGQNFKIAPRVSSNAFAFLPLYSLNSFRAFFLVLLRPEVWIFFHLEQIFFITVCVYLLWLICVILSSIISCSSFFTFEAPFFLSLNAFFNVPVGQRRYMAVFT